MAAKLYPENYDVAVEVGFTDLNGDPIVVTEINAKLYDGDDQVLLDMPTLPFDQADGAKSITIAAAFNLLGEGELSAARILRVGLKTDSGTVHRSFSYIIEGESRLELLNNTWVSLEAAELLLRDMPEAKAYLAASDDQRAAALINAYARMQRIRLRFQAQDKSSVYADCEQITVIEPNGWSDVPVDEFLGYPREFRKALRMAQICEANAILTDDPIRDRHRAGVISETVGESSMMLRGGQLQMGVSNDTLRYLAGHVLYRVSVSRV